MQNFNYQEHNTFYKSSSYKNLLAYEDQPSEIDADNECEASSEHEFPIFIARPKVLLVEDNLMLQILHTEMLTKIGCKVDLAEDGEKAVAMASKKAYDIILMDIGLPKMDGITATKAIRHQETKHHRSVIVALTTYSAEREQECREAGIDDFYTKPIQKNQLTHILTYWLPDLVIPQGAPA